jgi:hypothetical protein
MRNIAYLAAAIVAGLGCPHLFYTWRDFGDRPRYFRPQDRALLEAMKLTRTNIAPNGRDYWSGVLGFNLSHSLGLLMLALLVALATFYRIIWLEPLLVALAVAYAAIAWRCWFVVPVIGVLGAALFMTVGWWLGG